MDSRVILLSQSLDELDQRMTRMETVINKMIATYTGVNLYAFFRDIFTFDIIKIFHEYSLESNVTKKEIILEHARFLR